MNAAAGTDATVTRRRCSASRPLRTIAAPAFLLEHLTWHLTTYREADRTNPNALIFIGPKGGVLRRRFGERILRPATIRADLEGLTFHGLRHAAASSLVDVGVHPRVMAARIGHGTVKTTMEVYARASHSADHEAAKLLEQRFAMTFREGLGATMSGLKYGQGS